MRSINILSILIITSLLTGGVLILLTNNAVADDEINVCVTLSWQTEMVTWIGGDQITVTQFIEPGTDPHGGEQGTVGDLVSASKSIAYFYIGAEMEWEVTNIPILQQSFPDMAFINSSAGLTLLSVADEDSDEDEHEHGPINGHVWTLPSNLLVIAENVKIALSELDPENALIYEAGYISYIDRVMEIKILADNSFSGNEGNKFLVWHSAWQYLSEGYGLVEVGLESQVSSGMTAQDILDMVNIAEEEGLNTIFVRPQDPIWTEGSKFSLAQEDIIVIGADPLASDYLFELENFIINLKNSWNTEAV